MIFKQVIQFRHNSLYMLYNTITRGI